MKPHLDYVLVGIKAIAGTDIDWAVSLQLKRSESDYLGKLISPQAGFPRMLWMDLG